MGVLMYVALQCEYRKAQVPIEGAVTLYSTTNYEVISTEEAPSPQRRNKKACKVAFQIRALLTIQLARGFICIFHLPWITKLQIIH